MSELTAHSIFVFSYLKEARVVLFCAFLITVEPLYSYPQSQLQAFSSKTPLFKAGESLRLLFGEYHWILSLRGFQSISGRRGILRSDHTLPKLATLTSS